MERIAGRIPRDFLGRFVTGTSCLEVSPSKPLATAAGGDNDSGKLELSLGLSLNGCFGVDPKEKQKGRYNGGLVRSCSIASSSMFHEHEFMALTRTCSLPTEAEEELRKRKELQSLKRLEAKKKRIEKKTNLKSEDSSYAASMAVAPGRTNSGRIEFEINGCSPVAPGVIQLQVGKQVNGYPQPPGVPAWATGAGHGKIAPQRSLGSQGSVGSSGITELDNQTLQEERGPSVIEPLPDHSNHKKSPSPSPSSTAKPKHTQENQFRHNNVSIPNCGRDTERNVMEEMPRVTTNGVGPNGKRIEGFLYGYKKGEVRIVCVCHGDFLSPAQFVRHAGGGEGDYPLRHIVVYQTSAAFS